MMIAMLRQTLSEYWDAWNRFWFQPRLPHTLAAIRICTGLMMAYIHLIWLSDIQSFMGERAWIDGETIRSLHAGRYKWSYLWWTESTTLLMVHQILAIGCSLALAAGAFTRIVAPASWLMTLMVCHRMTGLLFGLDQVAMMLAMYLMISPCGSVYSIDAIRRRGVEGRHWLFPSSGPSTATNIATRLLQIHLCIIYLFGGISKLRGDMWWDGTALWYAVASYEYQSLDMTWLGHFPFLTAVLTHLTLFWETLYCALVWPRATRPWMIAIAVGVHGGIGLFLGMITFGWMMIVANGAFISPETTHRIFQGVQRWLGRGSSDTEPQNVPVHP